MSVEKEGIKGYEYQYLCTALIALKFINQYPDLSLIVENIEDAVYHFNGKTVYLQSKKHDNDITLNNFGAWMGHFGNRQFTDSLLSRLIKDGHYVIFYSTGRCEDSIKDFAKIDESELCNKKILKKEFMENFKSSVLNQIDAKTKLQKERKEHLKKILSNTELNTALKKVLIYEMRSVNSIEEEIKKILRINLEIRHKDTENLILKIDRIIRKGRDYKYDVIPDMRKVLNEHEYRLLSTEQKYIEVPFYSELVNRLINENVLLLTGVPFCGKTITARYIAEIFRKEDYDVKEVDCLNGEDGALSYIKNLIDDKRLVIISDPFGSVQISENFLEVNHQIADLLNNYTNSDRKVIITSRKNILLEAFDKNYISECSINKYKWNDLSMCDSEFAQKCWYNVYGNDNESKKVYDLIANLFSKECCVFLEVGEIFNLKNEGVSLQELCKMKSEKIVKKARISSEEIAKKIQNDGCCDAFVTLGLCCNTIRGVKLDDLPYIFSDTCEYPALNNKKYNYAFLMGGHKNSEKIPFPKYPENLKLSKENLRILELFKRRGYIEIKSKCVYFSHPVYHYASNLLLNKLINRPFYNKEELINIAKRCISALDKNVNICALEMLDKCMENNDGDILELFVLSLDTIFPATLDKAICIAEKYFDLFDEQHKEQIVRKITFYRTSKFYCWNDGEPYFPLSDELYESDYREYTNKSYMLDRNTVENVYEILQSDDGKLSLEYINKALYYDESMIRQRAVYLIFKYHIHEIENVNKYLNENENSHVIISIFEGALESFDKMSKEDFDKIITFYCNQLKRFSVVLISNLILNNFFDKYDRHNINIDISNANVVSAWLRIYSAFFCNFPVDYLKIEESKMEYCVRQANRLKDNIDKQYFADFFNSWNIWLNKVNCANDYGMSLMEYVIISLLPEDRKNLFLKLLETKKTSIITSHIFSTINNWDLLSDFEKKTILDLMNSNRVDLKWMKAMALTSRTIPEEIAFKILNCDITSHNINEIVLKLRELSLLEPCINIFCGYPQPLWYNGYHHQNKKFWMDVLKMILCDNIIDKAFDISLREFIDSKYNNIKFCDDSDLIWKNLLTNENKRKKVFEKLLHCSINQNYENKQMWTEFFKFCSDDEIEYYTEQISKYIEAIQYWQYGGMGILDQFDKKTFLKHIFSKIEPDNLIYKLIETASIIINESNECGEKLSDYIDRTEEKHENECLLKKLSIKVQNLYESASAPRTVFLGEIVKYQFEKWNILSNEITEVIEKRQKELIDIANEQIKKCDDHYLLDSWIK